MSDWFDSWHFASPWALILLLVLPFVAWSYYRRYRFWTPELRMPTLAPLAGVRSWKPWVIRFLPAVRLLSLAFLVIALARPQSILDQQDIKADGIDIMLAVDLSSSMLAMDFKPNRLEASKEVAKKFVEKRAFDRFGLVAFAAEAFTQCPLTSDHRVLNRFIDDLACGLLKDGTAIGDGLATAVNRIKDSEAESKVVILLTDGVNNSGYIKPLTSAEIAQEYNVRVYTIGVGSMGKALAPISRRSNGEYVFGMSAVEIDEELLRQISNLTGGRYYRATTSEVLEQIYEEIDQLEKTEMEISTVRLYGELFGFWLAWGLGLLLLERVLQWTLLRGINN